MAPTIKSAASPAPLTSDSRRASLDWGDWGSRNEAGQVSSAQGSGSKPSTSVSSPASHSSHELGYAKEDGFDKFMRVMDRLETTLEKLTGTNRDELIARNADRAWKGPFRF
jgi:hypothetical protein